MPKSMSFLIYLFLIGQCLSMGTNSVKNVNQKGKRNEKCADAFGEVETRSLEEIYQAALAEGGKLVVYAGGDSIVQQEAIKTGFEATFPNISLEMLVDYSKFLGARIDWQLANGLLQPDLTTLQSIHDFPRWKANGVLLQYKPANFSQIFTEFRDPDGFYTGVMVLAFGYLANGNLLNASDFPRQANDYLKPMFGGGKLAVTYPNDDDAVLFWFKQTIDKYGWQWMDKFVGQQPIYVRGTQLPQELMGNNTAAASMTTNSDVTYFVGNGTSPLRFTFPSNNDPFTVWAQTAAIFKGAKHPEAAKLFLNWLITKETYVRLKWA